MKKLIIISLVTSLCILTGTKSSRSQEAGIKQPDLILRDTNGNPISNVLNVDRCKSDFKLCIDVSESANTIPHVYKNGRSQEQTEKDAKISLSSKSDCNKNGCYTDASWDKGYNKNNIKFISKNIIIQENNSKRKVEVDLQAVIAYKEYQEGGILKKKFLITIKGTELDPLNLDVKDGKTNLEALNGSRSISDGSEAKVPRGFWDSAYVLVNTPEYKNLLKKIKESASKGEDFEVLVTGHSLGGAIATTVKGYIENSLIGESKNRVKAITFGSPPAGNKQFNDLYGRNVTAISIDGDPVPFSPVPNSQIIGTQYKFKMSEEQAKANQQAQNANSDYKWYNTFTYKNVIESNTTALKIALIDTHAAGYNNSGIANYNPATSTGWYDLRNELMLQNLNSITLGGSSHIGSASYYLGKSPNQDPRIELDGVKIKSLQEREQYITTAGSITNLKAPVDVVLNWNQSVAKGQLDLDSHLTAPAGLGDDSSVRSHTYFSSRGSIDTAPYVLLYRDVIPASGGAGAEQTRIQVLQNGVYRFYVHDYTNRDATTSTALSQSEANVKVYNFGQNLPTEGQNLGTQLGNTINVPTNQQGNVWRAFELDSRTGVLKPINAPLGNISAPASVPSIGESSVNNGGVGGK
jgi:hypothetical protein